MSAPSLANFIIKRPWLSKWMLPLSAWYKNAAGYRKLGLRYGYIFHCLELDWVDMMSWYTVC